MYVLYTNMSTKRRIIHKYEFRLFDFRDGNRKGSSGTYGRDNSYYSVTMYGINEEGKTCSIEVTDFKPFFYVRVDHNFTSASLAMFTKSLKSELMLGGADYYIDSFKTEIVDMKRLYGFTGGKNDRFVKLIFESMKGFSRVKQLWNTDSRSSSTGRHFDTVKYPIYESNIPALLRLFHINDITPSGWIKVRSKPCEDPTSFCDYSFVCKCRNLIPLPQKESVAPFKICSFDIEASSSHGDFPVPLKSYKKLAMNIVDTFRGQESFVNEGNAEALLRKIIHAAFGFGSFDDVDRVFPKITPTKASIDKLMDYMISTDIERLKDKHWDDKKEYVIKNVEFEDEEEDEEQKVQKKKSTKTKRIISALLNQKLPRDEKIMVLDVAMTSVLPELEGDKVTFVGSTFLKYGESESYRNHCLVLGSCDDVPGSEIESMSDERSLLSRWAEVICEEDPDIIVGYNIFGFDYEFMFRRAQECGCEKEFLRLSRSATHNEELAMLERDVCGKTRDEKVIFDGIETKQLVIASGEYDLKYYDIPGRLQIDMYTYFRRDFNLSSYKLDDVAGSYISDSVKKYVNTTNEKGEDVCELYSNNLTGLHVNDYIHVELVSFTVDYYAGGKKFIVRDIVTRDGKSAIVIDGHHTFDAKKKLKWGIAKDDVSPQDIFRLSNGDASDRAIVAKYCIQDCNLVHHLMNKIDVITGYVEMSNICTVPISFLVFRGQGIKLTSYVAKKCREKNTLMPDLEKKRNDGGYEGAIVLPPKCSMYMDNPVACVDYSSLYPSSMISQNYSHDSKVWTKEYDLEGNLRAITGDRDEDGNFIYDNLPGHEYIDTTFDTYEWRRKSETSRAEKVKVGYKTCRWAQLPNNEKSIMPAILTELLKARKDTRKKAKQETDPFMANILDKRQLGYKVTANSLYGQCGAQTSTFYEKDVAASTTATGREMIMYARRMIEEVYGDRKYTLEDGTTVKTLAEYVYGDTDSVFFTFNLKDLEGNDIRGQRALEITIEIAQDAADLCTQFLKPPMCLEYEKTLMPFILLSKKRYVGMLYEEDPKVGNLKYMGLSLKRRDSCDYLKDTYGEIINILMQQQNVSSAIDFLNTSLQQLIDGNVHMDKLAITRALRSDYKNPQQIGHKVLADRIGKRDPGNKPKPGDRIKYVFIPNKDRKALTGNRIETPEYIISNKLNIDYAHYITNQLMKPLQQLFSLAVEDIWKLQNKHAAIKTYHKYLRELDGECGDDLEQYMKKREKYCSTKVKTLLFDKYVKVIETKQARDFALETNHSVMSFFAPIRK